MSALFLWLRVFLAAPLTCRTSASPPKQKKQAEKVGKEDTLFDNLFSGAKSLEEKLAGDNAVKVLSAEGVRLRRGDAGFQLEYLLRVEEPDVDIW
jgi:hypothetical protein